MIIFYKNQKFNSFTINPYKININKNKSKKILKKINQLILMIKIKKINLLKINNK